MPDSISPVSSVSGSPSPPPTGKAVAPPPPPLGEPSVLSELDNDTSAKEPFPDLDESVPLDPPSGASSIEEARSTVHVHDIRPSRRPSLAGSTHKNLAVPSASPQPSNESRSPVLPPVPEPPKPTDDPAPEWDDEPPKKHHRSTHGPLPPPSPPSPSRHDEYKARGGRDSGDLDGASLSEAERMAAKERRAKKARSRSIAQAHPPSPPSDPQTGTHSRRMSVSHRDDKYSKTKSRRDHEREPEKASSPAKETHERPRERRGSIGGRERAEREKQKERDRIRQKEADREARKAKAAEKEKARAAAREKERERERDSTNDERTSEDDRGKEVNGDRERRGYRSRADSARTRDRGQSNDWSDDEERRDRHRRERRSSTRAREREETVRPHRRRTEDAEYDAHKVSRDTAAAAATISAAVAADGHHRRKNKVDFSDTGEESDWRGERSRNKSHNPRDVRFDEPRSRGSKPKTSRYDYNANPDGDYEYDQPRNPPISKPLPAPISQPHPSRTMSLRSRRDSQPLSPSVPEPAHEESKPRRWRDKFLRAPSLRRNKNPKPVLVPDTEPTPSPRSPTRGGRDGHGYDNRDVHIRPTSASDQRPYSPALQDETALESLSTQKLLALANNADLAHCQRIHIWLILCERKHGLHCSDEGRNTWRPSYLIDTTTYQLVEAPPGCRYAIWSYGDCDPIGDKSCKHERTTSENLDLFLTEGIPQDLIPPAYADAIWLTRKTRVQYLWIDHFCIVHDNQASRTEYVMNKPQLYANAVFTVIYAIRGLGKGLEPLDPEKDARGTGKEAARDAEDSVGLAGLQDKVSTTYWNTRAWTFGDKLYSRRALYIFPTNYVWRCHVSPVIQVCAVVTDV